LIFILSGEERERESSFLSLAICREFIFIKKKISFKDTGLYGRNIYYAFGTTISIAVIANFYESFKNLSSMPEKTIGFIHVAIRYACYTFFRRQLWRT